ncbi:MAG TPA: glycoside hydrolase family 3 C-terminal domain-containing protein [Candidatus Angelobacter sp.]|nr:glycoside hydrolase family 3 C-terminal domain-containing protein [Candidatus Angelobacter sp.]
MNTVLQQAKQVLKRLGSKEITFKLSALLVFGLVSAVATAQPAPAPAQVEHRVDSLVAQMTLEEKIDMLGGVDDFFVRGLPRLGIPRFKMADGPLGVRNYGPATTMAAGIALAATWDTELARRVGGEIGRDARAKGVHFLLGPGVNLYRAPMNGRNFEYFGEDPFLASQIAVRYIEGVQSQGVSATIKHFMGNNSEFDRHNSDSVIDERTMREIYLPVFEAAVKEASVGAVMDSYNLTNGVHMSQNAFLNRDVLKKEWGFEGVLMSDWSATYDGVAAANSGMDLEMPSGEFMNRRSLLPAIRDGRVSMATIDDKVRRILREAVRFGWLDRDQTDSSIPRYNQRGREAALQSARESMVLLKNEGGLLPLKKDGVKSIAVIGPDAYPAVPIGGGSARVEPFSAVSFLEGISNAFGGATNTYYNSGIPSLSEMAEATGFSTNAQNGKPGLRAEYFSNPELQGSPISTGTEQHINFGPRSRPSTPKEAASVRWTGYFMAQHPGAHSIFVASTGEDGGSYRLSVDGKPILDNWKSNRAMTDYATLSLDSGPHKIVLEKRGSAEWLGPRMMMGIYRHDDIVSAEAKKLAAQSDSVVLAVGFNPETESEAADRTFRLPPGQEQLIQEIAEANKNTTVVITSGGAVDMTPWLDKVRAVVQAWYPGQEGGTALAEILTGAVNPSGRLPVTFERQWEDNPAHDSYYPEREGKRVVYKEGVFVGYRGYEHNNKKPLFPFGYGLSYTSFRYANLEVKTSTAPNSKAGGIITVSFDIGNTGDREGAEVAQLYVADRHSKTPRPASELKGFARVSVAPGKVEHVTIELVPRSLAYYDVGLKQWRIEPGDFDILVGRSSNQIELRGHASIPETMAAALKP